LASKSKETSEFLDAALELGETVGEIGHSDSRVLND